LADENPFDLYGALLKGFSGETLAMEEKFVETLEKTRWFRPDGQPKPEWNLFYGDTWGMAQNAAGKAAFEFGMPPLLDPGSPKDPTPPEVRGEQLRRWEAYKASPVKDIWKQYGSGRKALAEVCKKFARVPFHPVNPETAEEWYRTRYASSLEELDMRTYKILQSVEKEMGSLDWHVYRKNSSELSTDSQDSPKTMSMHAHSALSQDVQDMFDMIKISFLNFPDKDELLQHSKNRMEVWEKGYALAEDVGLAPFSLYVYCMRLAP
jgi:hypothetical protein